MEDLLDDLSGKHLTAYGDKAFYKLRYAMLSLVFSLFFFFMIFVFFYHNITGLKACYDAYVEHESETENYIGALIGHLLLLGFASLAIWAAFSMG